MKPPFHLLAGALSLSLLAGCHHAPLATLTTRQLPAAIPVAAAPTAAPEALPAPAAPAVAANLTGTATVFSEAFADADVQLTVLGEPEAAAYHTLAASVLASGKSQADGRFALDVPADVAPGTPLKLTLSKDGQALVTMLLAGDAHVDVRVTQSTTLACLLLQLDTLARGLFTSVGHPVDSPAGRDMLNTFVAASSAIDKGLTAEGEGRTAVTDALKADYVVAGAVLPESVSTALAGAATAEVGEAFTDAAIALNVAVKLAAAAGGEQVTTNIALGGLSRIVTSRRSSGGGSRTPSIPETDVTAEGTFELPTGAPVVL